MRPRAHAGPQRPRGRPVPVREVAEDILQAVNRESHILQARLRSAHHTYRKAMRRPIRSNGRTKMLAQVREVLESVDREARMTHVHDEVMQPIFVELLAALRSGRL